MINCLLLFHKCGNNYANNVHRLSRRTRYVRSVEPGDAETLRAFNVDGKVTNLRCRNFGRAEVERSGALDDDAARFLVFTRHPASFVWSAAKYHERGIEEWATMRPLQSLNGKTLTQALRDAESLDEKHITIMNHFAFLYERQASLMEFEDDPRFKRLRTEDLFNAHEPAYYQDIAQFLRLPSRGFQRALMKASPAFKRKLPKHSTGAFQIKDPYQDFGDQARAHYDEHWLPFATRLGYQ